MESYNKKILIIADKMEEIYPIQNILKLLGYLVEPQSNPESGLAIASHKYSIIFIDYQFDNSTKYTGTSLCCAIRKKCPLSTIILLTNYGKENIGNFVYADWDGYFDKESTGARARDLDDLMKDCVAKAITLQYTLKLPILNKISQETKAINDKRGILDKLEQLYNNNPDAKN